MTIFTSFCSTPTIVPLLDMANPPTIVLSLRAEAPLDNAVVEPTIKNVVDVPAMGNPNDVLPRRSSRRRRVRAGDRFQPTGSNFSLKLTDGEIEEDIYAMTGALPRDHPHRRPAPLQEKLNRLVPGGSLAGLTPETYPLRPQDP
ncbi:hypothetical protein PVAP13_8KG379800 [Panicum virgatum]|uniref:Uncharacterized protein n=1 Tax=Panicum virgatum TaxID=38727 RepID=A0A8T0PPX6_PANVG|nr:hypothetical protein PVAP13_8KG379800 [Panicum virgatum]